MDMPLGKSPFLFAGSMGDKDTCIELAAFTQPKHTCGAGPQRPALKACPFTDAGMLRLLAWRQHFGLADVER